MFCSHWQEKRTKRENSAKNAGILRKNYPVEKSAAVPTVWTLVPQGAFGPSLRTEPRARPAAASRRACASPHILGRGMRGTAVFGSPARILLVPGTPFGATGEAAASARVRPRLSEGPSRSLGRPAFAPLPEPASRCEKVFSLGPLRPRKRERLPPSTPKSAGSAPSCLGAIPLWGRPREGG
jgi:hypothetical protein